MLPTHRIFFEPETFFCKPGELSTKDTGAVALLKGKKVEENKPIMKEHFLSTKQGCFFT